MGTLVHIVPMTGEDVPAVVAMADSARAGEEELRADLTRLWTRAWVANEDPVGIVGFVLAWHVLDELHVLDLATRVDRRRRGIARALMGQVLAYARGGRVRHMLLEVRASNAPAIALYRTTGFSAARTRARYYPDDEDALEMSLFLDPETGAPLLTSPPNGTW